MRGIIELPEFLFIVGMAILGIGLWVTVGWWVLVIIGTILSALGLLLAYRGI